MATCPKCSVEVQVESTECPACGIIFQKYLARQQLKEEDRRKIELEAVRIAQAHEEQQKKDSRNEGETQQPAPKPLPTVSMRKNLLPKILIPFLLVIITVGFFGYNFWEKQQIADPEISSWVATKEAFLGKFRSDVTVDGEIFIVTKSRENIKMGLVEVGLIPMRTLLPLLEAKHVIFKNELAILEPKLEAAKKEGDTAKKKWETVKKNKEEYESISRLMNDHNSLQVRGRRMGQGEAELARLNAESQILDNKLAQEEALLESLKKAVKTAKAEDNKKASEEKLMSGNISLQSISSPSQTTKTNADGHFHLISNVRLRTCMYLLG